MHLNHRWVYCATNENIVSFICNDGRNLPEAEIVEDVLAEQCFNVDID